MPAEAVAYRPIPVDERKPSADMQNSGLMTPARRAGLEALEREFNEYLKAQRP
jgi:hypothetical protein